MRLRKRAAGLVLGAAILFLIGTNVQAGWLYVLSALLLGALTAGLILPFVALRGLSVELDAPEEAAQGIASVVEVRVHGPAHGVRRNVTVRDAHLEWVETGLAAIPRGGGVAVRTLRAPGRRGEAITGAVQLRSAAPFGVAERRRRFPVDARTLVHPRIYRLGTLAFLEPVATNEPAVREAPRRGQGPDYLGVRGYRAGDPMRHVHWGLTARHGQLMVREFEEERTRRLAVILDTERDEGETWTPLDRSCSVAGSVLDAAAAHGQGARLIAALPGRGIDVLPRPDRSEMRRWLARLQPSGVPLEEVLRGLGPEDLRGIETVMIAMPVWGPGPRAALAEEIRSLARRVTRIVCVLVAAAPAAADARVVTAELAAAGAAVHPWAPEEDLAACLASPRDLRQAVQA